MRYSHVGIVVQKMKELVEFLIEILGGTVHRQGLD